MFLLALESINKQKNLQIPQQNLEMLNLELSKIMDNRVFPVINISRKVKVNSNTIFIFLSELYFRDLILAKFTIRCSNDDPDMIHSFSFPTQEEMLEFYKENSTCPSCNDELDMHSARVYFIKSEINYQDGKEYV